MLEIAPKIQDKSKFTKEFANRTTDGAKRQLIKTDKLVINGPIK